MVSYFDQTLTSANETLSFADNDFITGVNGTNTFNLGSIPTTTDIAYVELAGANVTLSDNINLKADDSGGAEIRVDTSFGIALRTSFGVEIVSSFQRFDRTATGASVTVNSQDFSLQFTVDNYIGTGVEVFLLVQFGEIEGQRDVLADGTQTINFDNIEVNFLGRAV